MANLIGIISIAVILMFAIPASSARHHRKDGDLRDLCSKTHDPELCWKVLKPQGSIFHTDTTGVVEVAIELAKGKANEFQEEFSRLGEESMYEKMMEKCSNNYGDVIRDVNEAKRLLHKREYSGIPMLVDDVIDEVTSCRNILNDGTSDHAYVQNMNMEFRVYADLLKVAVDRLLKEQRD